MSDDERSVASGGTVAGEPRNGALSTCETVPDADSRVRETYPPVCHVFSQKNLTLTDAERDDLRVWLAECLRQASTATEGGNEELAERWQGRAHRAAAMLERLGGGQ